MNKYVALAAVLFAVTLSAAAEEVPGFKKQTSPARYLERVPLGVSKADVVLSLGLPTIESEVGGQLLLQYELEYALTKAVYIFVLENDALVDVLYRQGNRRESAKERQSGSGTAQ